jgi:hypothetical protein
MTAATSITFSTPEHRVNERSSVAVVARFRDSSGDVTPTNVKYRLDGECGEITGWTTATPGTTATITLTPTETAIQNDTRSSEAKYLSVAADYGLSTQFINTLRLDVRNQGYLS